jgi:hypothetical protein
MHRVKDPTKVFPSMVFPYMHERLAPAVMWAAFANTRDPNQATRVKAVLMRPKRVCSGNKAVCLYAFAQFGKVEPEGWMLVHTDEWRRGLKRRCEECKQPWFRLLGNAATWCVQCSQLGL